MESSLNIGIFGGAFNPPHNGHINAAKAFIEGCNLDILYVVPTYISPFKEDLLNNIKLDHISLLVQEAFAKIPKVTISDFEISKKSISYTIDTVRYFKKIHEKDDIFLLIGLDNAFNFYLWKEYQEILKLVTIVIANRDIKINHDLDPKLQEIFGSYIDLKTELIDISSSQIRNKVFEDNQSLLIPTGVKELILKLGLYQS